MNSKYYFVHIGATRSRTKFAAASVYALVCGSATYLVGSAPGEDITFWRLSIYGLAIGGSILFGAITRPGEYSLIPIGVALVLGIIDFMVAQPFFDPWYPIPLALFATAETTCIGLGVLWRRGTLKRALVASQREE